MDQIAFSYLVYKLTGSAIYLGLLNLSRFAPILFFTLIGGVVADRVERRKLMFSTQSVAMVLALLLAILVSTNLIQIWMVFAIGVGRGIMNSFNQPARQSLISELVPEEDLMNAIAVNSMTVNLTQVMGPVIGGILIATVGVAGAFYLNAATFLGVLYALAMMKFTERPQRRHASVVKDLAGGVAYVSKNETLRALVLLALVPMIFGMPYQIMLTVFAEDVLHIGGAGLGIMQACSAIGAILGAFVVASFQKPTGRGRTMIIGLIAFGLALAAFSLSRWVLISLLALIAVGMSRQVYMSLNNTLVQTYVDEKYRGRVLSTLFLNRSMVPLGSMIAGVGTAMFGVQPSMAAMGAALMAIALVAFRFAPAARDLD